MKHIILMGAPGTGRGTQAALLATRLAVPHITTRGLLHDQVARDLACGVDVAEVLRSGRYVDDAIMTDLMRHRLRENDVADGVVLDGYPQTLTHVTALDRFLADRDAELNAVVLLRADESTLTARLTARAGGRADANKEVILERIARYEAQTAAVVSTYADRGVLRGISGAYPVDLVADAILAAVRAEHHPVELYGVPIR